MIELHKGLEIREVPGEDGFFAREDGTIWTDWAQYHDRWHQWLRGEDLISAAITYPKNGSYPIVRLFTKWERLHVIMLTSFVGEGPYDYVARHFPDSDVYNNDIRNLKWGTRTENMQDAIRDGTAGVFTRDIVNHPWTVKGARNPLAILTQQEVDEIRKLYSSGQFAQWQIGEMYGVHQNTISRVIRGVRYA